MTEMKSWQLIICWKMQARKIKSVLALAMNCAAAPMEESETKFVEDNLAKLPEEFEFVSMEMQFHPQKKTGSKKHSFPLNAGCG